MMTLLSLPIIMKLIFRKQWLHTNDNKYLLIPLHQIWPKLHPRKWGNSQSPVPKPASPSPNTDKLEPVWERRLELIRLPVWGMTQCSLRIPSRSYSWSFAGCEGGSRGGRAMGQVAQQSCKKGGLKEKPDPHTISLWRSGPKEKVRAGNNHEISEEEPGT